MKYILLSDLSESFKKLKYIFAYIIILFGYTFYKLIIIKTISTKNINIQSLGYLLETKDFVDILMFLLNIFFVIYMIFPIFIKEMKYGGDNIFPRINKYKYTMTKLLSITIIVFLLRLLANTVIFIATGHVLTMAILTKDLVISLLICHVFNYLHITFKTKVQGLIVFSLLIIIGIISKVTTTILLNKENYIIPISIVIIIFINIKIHSNLFAIYERENKL